MGRDNFGGKGRPVVKYREALRELCKNVRTDGDAIWDAEFGGSNKLCIRWGEDAPTGRDTHRGVSNPCIAKHRISGY